MSFLGNLLWIIFGGGIVIFFEYLLAGLVLCLTIIGIPFGVQCFKIAALGLFPFGKETSERPSASGALSLVMNVIWVFLGGIWIALTHLGFAIVCAITIIGIPFAVQHLKLAKLSLVPFGREIYSIR